MFPLAVCVGSLWGVGDYVIPIVVIAAVIAVLYVATKAMGVEIPQWAVKIFWIVVIAIVAIFAIRFLLSM